LEIKKAKRAGQLTAEQVREAKSRLKWYEQRDQDKIKNDKALNDFESMIYKLRDWLREEDNEPYVLEEDREALMEKLMEHEDWIYDEGATANFTTFEKLYKTLNTQYGKLEKRRAADVGRDQFIKDTFEKLEKFDESVQDLKETKSWISDEERKDVSDKIAEVRTWFNEQVEKQAALKKHEDPILDTAAATKKLNSVSKLYTKVSSKKKPKPPKPEKKKEDEEKKEEEKPEEAQQETQQEEE